MSLQTFTFQSKQSLKIQNRFSFTNQFDCCLYTLNNITNFLRAMVIVLPILPSALLSLPDLFVASAAFGRSLLTPNCGWSVDRLTVTCNTLSNQLLGSRVAPTAGAVVSRNWLNSRLTVGFRPWTFRLMNSIPWAIKSTQQASKLPYAPLDLQHTGYRPSQRRRAPGKPRRPGQTTPSPSQSSRSQAQITYLPALFVNFHMSSLSSLFSHKLRSMLFLYRRKANIHPTSRLTIHRAFWTTETVYASQLRLKQKSLRVERLTQLRYATGSYSVRPLMYPLHHILLQRHTLPGKIRSIHFNWRSQNIFFNTFFSVQFQNSIKISSHRNAG